MAPHAGQDQERCQRKYPGLPDWGLGHVEGEEQKINLDLEFSEYVGWVVNVEA